MMTEAINAYPNRQLWKASSIRACWMRAGNPVQPDPQENLAANERDARDGSQILARAHGPALFRATAGSPVIAGPRSAQDDQPPPGVVCQMRPSLPSGPTANASRPGCCGTKPGQGMGVSG